MTSNRVRAFPSIHRTVRPIQSFGFVQWLCTTDHCYSFCPECLPYSTWSALRKQLTATATRSQVDPSLPGDWFRMHWTFYEFLYSPGWWHRLLVVKVILLLCNIRHETKFFEMQCSICLLVSLRFAQNRCETFNATSNAALRDTIVSELQKLLHLYGRIYPYVAHKYGQKKIGVAFLDKFNLNNWVDQSRPISLPMQRALFSIVNGMMDA